MTNLKYYRASIVFLQTVVVLIGLGALSFMIWEPLLEGRNAHASLLQIYFTDYFLAFAYVASIPFFVALYQIFKVLQYIGKNNFFTQKAVKALQKIRYCAIAMIGFVAIGEILIRLNGSDDPAGGIFMGILIAFASMVMGASATVFEGILKKAEDKKS